MRGTKLLGHRMERTPLWMIACVTAVFALGALAGCRWQAKRRVEPPAVEATHAAPRSADGAASDCVGEDAEACVEYPAGWKPTSSRDFVLMLVPAKSPAPSAGGARNLRWGEHFISLDIPKLPAVRIPGFLPMDRIRGGYVDHLRKQAPDAKVEDLESPPIPDAETALLRTTWPGDRPTHIETALILTHDDRVYILRGRSRTEDEPATRAAFDHVAQSLRWNGN